MGRATKPAKAKPKTTPSRTVSARASATPSRTALKREGGRVQDLEKRLAEALKREADSLKREADAHEQQTASSEILRVISRSQTDVQPVFHAILGSGVRLLSAYAGVLTLIQNQQIELAALTSTDDTGDTA